MKAKNPFISTLFYFIILFIILYIVLNIVLYLSCLTASYKIEDNNNQEYLRVMIYGSSATPEGNTVSGTFSIIDSNGN